MSGFVPDRKGFFDLLSRGRLTFVYRESLADGLTPVSTYARLGRGPYSFLLESVVGGEKWASYSFVGVRPRKVFRARGQNVEILRPEGDGFVVVERREEKDPFAALGALVTELSVAVPPGLPRFFGGAVGWLGYDSVRWFERLPARVPDELGLPEACFALTDTVVIFDNLRGTIKVVAAVDGGDGDPDRAYDNACARIDAVMAKLNAPGAAVLPPLDVTPLDPAAIPEPRSNTARADYEAGVRKVQEYIKAGDAFQVVLSQRFDVARQGIDPFDVYRLLRVTNPSPYMFHLEFPEAIVTGASPECLVRKEGSKVEVRPIAGTRRRGATPDEDAALEAELRRDEKEVAEHVMLIDLGRNDVGRVSAPATVKVDETMVVERYSHVMHLVSNVSGKLAPGKTASEVVRAAFPAGTLSGAPKIRAMEIIEELEPARRGIYGGAVGYLSYAGNADLAIAIRTLVTRGDTIHVQAGAGIVADSVPAAEHQECVSKARAVIQAVEMARASRAAQKSAPPVSPGVSTARAVPPDVL
jgi:anthranilate synthase component I